VVLAASIDLHIDSRKKFLRNASREHLVKLSILFMAVVVAAKRHKLRSHSSDSGVGFGASFF
jgi:hypothetical protein